MVASNRVVAVARMVPTKMTRRGPMLSIQRPISGATRPLAKMEKEKPSETSARDQPNSSSSGSM